MGRDRRRTLCGGISGNGRLQETTGPGGIYAAPTNRRMICGIQRQTRRGQDPSLQASKSLPPWGKVAPQGRMRGKLPGSSRLLITCGPGVPGPYEPAGASPLTETKTKKAPAWREPCGCLLFMSISAEHIDQDTSGNGGADNTGNVGAHGVHEQVVAGVVLPGRPSGKHGRP